MRIAQRIAQNLREVYFGGNWTVSNLNDQLADVTWEEATAQVYELNSIAKLLTHMHYFIRVTTKALEGGSLEGSDKESFEHEPIASEADWNTFKACRYKEAEKFIAAISEIPNEKMGATFFDEKWGDYYRNLQGIIEHNHYHLGQIAIIKKILRAEKDQS